MKHSDLGEMNGSVLLFGGPYSNAHAVVALEQAARDRGMSGAQVMWWPIAVILKGLWHTYAPWDVRWLREIASASWPVARRTVGAVLKKGPVVMC